jgi:hypothetical protein
MVIPIIIASTFVSESDVTCKAQNKIITVITSIWAAFVCHGFQQNSRKVRRATKQNQ